MRVLEIVILEYSNQDDIFIEFRNFISQVIRASD